MVTVECPECPIRNFCRPCREGVEKWRRTGEEVNTHFSDCPLYKLIQLSPESDPISLEEEELEDGYYWATVGPSSDYPRGFKPERIIVEIVDRGVYITGEGEEYDTDVFHDYTRINPG